MKMTYHRDKEHNYMVLEAPKQVQGEEYQVRMVLLNEIPGLLRCRMRTVDGKHFFDYEITSRQPLSRVLEQRLAGEEELLAFAVGISRALDAVRSYLLEDAGLLLEPELIYMDVETKEVLFAYLPLCSADLAQAFRRLTEYFLTKVDHQDKQAVFVVYQLYGRTAAENYSVGAAIRDLPWRREEKERCGGHTKDRPPQEKRSCGIEEADVKETKLSVSEMRTGQELVQRRKKQRVILAELLLAAAVVGVLAAGYFCGMLTLTQTGGLLFLGATVSMYALAGMKEKGKRERKGLRIFQKRRLFQRRKKQKGYMDLEEQEKERKEEKDEANQKRVYQKSTAREQSKTCGGSQKEAGGEDEICEFCEEAEEPKEERYGQTMLLGERAEQAPVLVSMVSGMRKEVLAEGKSFVIGKLKSQVDFAIDVPSVSRIHAGIEKREGRYFLADFNSKNGTFLNGERLNANEYRKLHTGDEIFFAKEGYYFRI